MTEYQLTWVTPHIATGRAPKSYEDLDHLKDCGIDAILNLCGEFSDLHELEEGAGFEVFWLPTPDEHPPTMAEMEKGLAWLDEAVYLGKKVLVHCHYGIGRTGTFITAYLLRRGFNLRKAGKVLKKSSTPANPSNFSQWWMLRKFGKKEGQLTTIEPDPQNRKTGELDPFVTRYELLLESLSQYDQPGKGGKKSPPQPCSMQTETRIHLIEALHLNSKINTTLTAEERNSLLGLTTDEGKGTDPPGCPFTVAGICRIHSFRPVTIRLHHISLPSKARQRFEKELAQISEEVFAELFGIIPGVTPPKATVEEAITGRFIQNCFQLLATRRINSKNTQ